MRWSDIPFSPPTRTLRVFAGLWLVFFGLACARLLAQGRATPAWVLGAVATLGVLGLYRPVAVRPAFVASMVLTFPISWAVSRLVLAVTYYGLFAPLGLVFRLAGRDALGLRLEPGRASYWEPRPADPDPRSYFRQF
jgi:hypothetical protein